VIEVSVGGYGRAGLTTSGRAQPGGQGTFSGTGGIQMTAVGGAGGVFSDRSSVDEAGGTPIIVPSGDMPVMASICPGGDHVWALDVNGGVWRWNGQSFERVPGKLRSLSVGPDGSIWGTDYQHNIYRRTQNGWQQVRGRLLSVAVANQNNVWGITPEGTAVRYLGSGQWEPATSFVTPM